MDTVEFYPSKFKMSTLSTRVTAVKDPVELTKALKNITYPTKIQLKNYELKEIQKISTIFTDVATSKVSESRSDKQLPRVDKIYPDNSMEKENNSPDCELPRVDRQVTKEVNMLQYVVKQRNVSTAALTSIALVDNVGTFYFTG